MRAARIYVHADLVKPLNNLADIYKAAGQYSKAEPLYLMQEQIPEILHLATHGFFLNDSNYTSLSKGTDESEELRGLKILPDKKGINTGFDNPLLSSGIVLAGANTALKK